MLRSEKSKLNKHEVLEKIVENVADLISADLSDLDGLQSDLTDLLKKNENTTSNITLNINVCKHCNLLGTI